MPLYFFEVWLNEKIKTLFGSNADATEKSFVMLQYVIKWKKNNEWYLKMPFSSRFS